MILFLPAAEIIWSPSRKTCVPFPVSANFSQARPPPCGPPPRRSQETAHIAEKLPFQSLPSMFMHSTPISLPFNFDSSWNPYASYNFFSFTISWTDLLFVSILTVSSIWYNGILTMLRPITTCGFRQKYLSLAVPLHASHLPQEKYNACWVCRIDVKGREIENWKSVENKGFPRVWTVWKNCSGSRILAF